MVLSHSTEIFLIAFEDTGCPKIVLPCLFGFCGGAVDSVVLVFTQLHSSGFN